MDILLWLAIAAIAITGVLAIVAFFLWRRLQGSSRRLTQRVVRLPMRSKLALASALVQDERVPAGVRLLPPLLVLYLALPIDLVPDFIPVLGQLDDLVMAAVGIGLVLRFVPSAVIEEHLSRLELAAPGQRETTGP